MRTQHTSQRIILVCASLVGLLAAAGCGLAPPMIPPHELPAEISAVVEGREAVRITADDPFFDAEAGTVVDDLSGLDGCWASYLAISSPEDTPFFPAGTPLFDSYEFFRFDFDTAEMTRQMYGELIVASFANVVTWDGTFTVIGDNRLRFTIETMAFNDPLSGEMLTFPESLLEEEDLDEETRAELLAELQADMIWEYLVTLDGDRVLLIPVWEDEETGEEVSDPNEASVCVRFECP